MCTHPPTHTHTAFKPPRCRASSTRWCWCWTSCRSWPRTPPSAPTSTARLVSHPFSIAIFNCPAHWVWRPTDRSLRSSQPTAESTAPRTPSHARSHAPHHTHNPTARRGRRGRAKDDPRRLLPPRVWCAPLLQSCALSCCCFACIHIIGSAWRGHGALLMINFRNPCPKIFSTDGSGADNFFDAGSW